MKRVAVFMAVFWVALVFAVSAGAAGADSGTEQASKDSSLESYESDLDFLEEDIESDGPPVADPLYYFNVVMYHFNDTLYYGILMPISTGYAAVLPEASRRGIRNFFNNLMTPVRVVSCLLQAKVDGAGRAMVRFLVNSTAGVVGFMDPATDDIGIELQDEDLGQALGSYGVGEGFYLVLPFGGPSSLRDAVGGALDRFLTPVAYVDPFLLSQGISGLELVNNASFVLGKYETIQEAAIDPYVAFKDLYIQYRRNKVAE